MTDPTQIDPARLAALIDGRLNDADAAQSRAELAAAGDDVLAAFADAVAIQGELGLAEPIPSAPRKIASAPSWRRWSWQLTAGAAAAAALLVFTLRDRPAGNSANFAVAYATALGGTARVPSTTAWGEVRGASDALSPTARAVRVGALVVDAEVAARAGGSPKDQLQSLASLLQGVSAGSTTAAELRDLAAAPDVASTTSRRTEVEQRAIGLVNASLANAGAWLEAARIASMAGDTSFLAAFPPAKPLDAISNVTAQGSSQAQAVADLSGATLARPLDAPALQRAVESLLSLLTR